MSFYPELDDLNKEFQPFSELIEMAYNVTTSVKEWRTEKLYGQSHEDIKTSVFEWQAKCKMLAKKLDEEYPGTADVARTI